MIAKSGQGERIEHTNLAATQRWLSTRCLHHYLSYQECQQVQLSVPQRLRRDIGETIAGSITRAKESISSFIRRATDERWIWAESAGRHTYSNPAVEAICCPEELIGHDH